MPTSLDFFRTLTTIARRMDGYHRWQHFDTVASLPPREQETVLEHTFHTVFLTLFLLDLEESHGTHASEINRERLLLASLLHDLGEGMIGDVAYRVKQDKRVKEGLRAIEQEMVEDILVSVPEFFRDRLRTAYHIVDSETIEGRFFNAVERLGYILYARDRVERGDDSFIQVYIRQNDKILELARLFESVRMVYAEHEDHIARKIRLYEEGKRLCGITGAHNT